MFFIEFIESQKLMGVDPNDLTWARYQPGFDSEERAHNEARWLSLDDDGRYVYRVIPAEAA